jgi:hypothetical protein
VQLQVLAFILLLALAVAQSWLVAKALLALALIIIPMSTARLLTARSTPWLIYWMGCASCSVWLGLWLAARSIWLPTAFIVTTSLMLHPGARWLVGKMGVLSRGLAYGQHRLSHLRVGSSHHSAAVRAAEITRRIMAVREYDSSGLGYDLRIPSDKHP